MCGTGFAFTNPGERSFEEVQSYEQYTHAFFKVGTAHLVRPATGFTGCSDRPFLHLGSGINHNADSSNLVCVPGILFDGKVVWSHLDYAGHGFVGLCQSHLYLGRDLVAGDGDWGCFGWFNLWCFLLSGAPRSKAVLANHCAGRFGYYGVS